MHRWFKPKTLLGRTAQALAIAFLLFALFAAVLLQVTLVRPHTRQAADDLAALLVLTAQIWVELPPITRPDYEKELLRRHELRILETEAAHATRSNSHSYLRYLETALSKLVGQPVTVHRHPGYEGWLWTDFSIADRVILLGFKEDRLQNRLLLILPFLAAIGVFVAFALSVLLVRRITRPLATMAEATHRIGEGDFGAKVPETGPQEIAELARMLNVMERQIRQLLENRTTLLAGISHDLRTPLARMRIELELLQGDENATLVEGLGNDIAEMEALIAQTLLLAKGLGGEEPSMTDLGQLLTDVTADFSSAGVRVSLHHWCNHAIAVRADALKRVIRNLLENAIAYGEGKPVTVTCRRGNETVDICIEDQGPGIPPSEYEDIFQPFHRLETSRNKATGGSGLGLAIVHQLCDAYGWSIEVGRSHAGGTVFTVHLPIATG